ncbi:MAG: hypothetical protein ABW118_13975 [Candidatus Thiodiazotropha sp.]
MTQLSSTQIDQQIDQLRKAIQNEEENHRKLSFEYIETGDKSLMEKMTGIRNTITFYRDTISANEEVRKVALAREAKEFDEKRERERKDDRKKLKKLFMQRVEVAKRLDKKFAELGEVMEEFKNITKQCYVDSPRNFRDKSGLVSANMFGGAPQVFGWRNVIYKAGLTLMAGPNFNRRYPSDPYADATLADCIAKQHERLGFSQEDVSEEEEDV